MNKTPTLGADRSGDVTRQTEPVRVLCSHEEHIGSVLSETSQNVCLLCNVTRRYVPTLNIYNMYDISYIVPP